MLATIVVISHFSKLAVGTAAVELFFVLSGFWIYRMYDGKYSRATHPVGVFVASRLLRILPIFLLCNGLAILLHLSLHDGIARLHSRTDVIPNVLILGYASLPERPMVPAWSLDIELQFYLIFPLIFSFYRRLGRSSWIWTLSILALGAGYMALFLRDDSHNVLAFLGFFLIGSVCAKETWRPTGQLVWASASLFIICLLAVTVIPSLRGFSMVTVDSAKFTWNAALNCGFALLLTPLALSSVFIRSNKRDRLLGELSYVVYCSHWLAVTVAAHYLSSMGKIAKAPFLLALLVMTYSVSLLLLLYVDRPITDRRERWIGRHLRGQFHVSR